jgi:hypothetical protein
MVGVTFYRWWNEQDVRTPSTDSCHNGEDIRLRVFNSPIRHSKTFTMSNAEDIRSTLRFLLSKFRSSTRT